MKKEYTYTEALARVEQLVKELEAGTCDIDKMPARIEEAQRLLAFCTKHLQNIEEQYKLILEAGDGQG